MARSIVITSGKGGVGKSSITAYLGKALAALNKKVVLIDADLGLKNLDVILGVESRVIYDIEDVIKGRCSLSKGLVQDKEYQNLYLLPSSIRLDVLKFNEDHFMMLINELHKSFDFILIDCPAGIEKGFQIALKGASEAIVVTTLDKSSIKDADKVIGILKSNDFTNIKLIINRVDKKKAEVQLNIKDVLRILEIPLLGLVYEDKNIPRMQNYGQALKLLNSDNFIVLASKIIGQPTLNKETNLLSKLLKLIKSS